MGTHHRSLDENGIRYLLFAKLLTYSQNNLPENLRVHSLMSKDICWGFFSESQVMK